MNRVASLVAVTVLSAAALAACSSSSTSSSSTDKPTKPTVRLGLVQGQDFTHALPAYTAAAQGFFGRHDLTVQIVAFSAGSDLVKAMAGGTVDVAEATGLDVVSAAASDVDLKAFYGTAAQTPMSVIVKASSPIHSVADLKGRSIGISKFGSLTDFEVRTIAQKSGIPLTAIKEVPLGAPSANTAALARGDVDAIMLPIGFSYTLQASGTPVTAIPVAGLTPDSQFAVLAASSGYLSKHKAEATNLVAAYSEAITFIQSHEEVSVALAVAKLGLKAGAATQTYNALAKDFTPTGAINAAGLKSYAVLLPALKIASTTPAESDYLDTAFTSSR
jgi:NitT/TauT family transport system substrate-binding protein